MYQQTYPYQLPPLPYAYDALEPMIDAETMHYHHDKHFATYVNNLNDTVAHYPALQHVPLRALLAAPQRLPTHARTSLMHNGGGAVNHARFFAGLCPASEDKRDPQGILLQNILRDFGSMDALRTAFIAQATAVFGSGWTALVLTLQGKLRIVSFANQDVLSEKAGKILLLADVWEHAYYLKYKNARADYLSALWNVFKFPLPEKQCESCKQN